VSKANRAKGRIQKRLRNMSEYITENQRYIIETMLKDGKNPKEIADRIGKHYTTIYREIKRGTVVLRDWKTWKDIPTYCADVSQRKQEKNSHNKGVVLKYDNDLKTIKYMEHLIKEKRYSAYAVQEELQRQGKTRICVQTIYNYINNGVFIHVDRNDLIYNKTKKKKEVQSRRPSLKNTGAKSIEERPRDISKRKTFGHWEMDTVYSGKGKNTACLLVLTERMTRIEIIRKLKARTASEVVKAINRLEKQLGIQQFRKIFKTITCDNGVEFAKWQNIEQGRYSKGQRTTVYFCHAFASSERGSNENANKLIRKYIPKGCDISIYTSKQIAQIQDIINNYPRKLFDGLSSLEYAYSIGL